MSFPCRRKELIQQLKFNSCFVNMLCCSVSLKHISYLFVLVLSPLQRKSTTFVYSCQQKLITRAKQVCESDLSDPQENLNALITSKVQACRLTY
jgi:hypothetical protein